MKFLLTLVLSLFAFRVVSAVPATQILVVHSYSQHYPWTNRQDDGFMEVLAGDARLKASVTTEYLDTKRRAYDGTYAKEMARFFGMKYAGYQPAAIYVTDDDALLFALDHLSGIFPGTPVFFSGVNDYGALKTLDPSLATGVFELKEVVPNIDWLRAFDKNANDLIFLGDGTSTYVAIEKEARKALASTGIRATFIAEKNLGFAMDRLRDLPGKYVILATVGGMTDENGNVLPLPEIVKGIVRTGRTIISMEDSYVMEGALGGWVTSGQEQGKAAARLLLAYLHGKPVAELPPILKSPNAMLFDDAALQKRGIQLPGNLRDQAILLNPRPDFYEKHHFLIVGSLFGLVGALFLAVTGGVVVLSRRNRQLHLARQRAEIAVIDQHEALERIQKIASRVPGVVYVYRLRPDGTSCFPFASDAIRDIYRVTPQEVSEDASKVFANLHPDDCDGVVESIQKSARDLTPWQHEYRLKFDDGTVLQLYGNAVPHREADGSVLWHGFIIDITERKQKDSELRQLVERLALATKAGQVGIWDLDVVNNALVWDDNMYSQYGITSDQFAGAYEAWTAGVHPDDRDRGDAEIQMALRGEKDFNTDFRVLWPDGSIHHIRAMALVQRNAAGEPLHMVGTNWDITKLKRAESTLLQNLARAEELTRLKSRFVSMASHELRTPLSNILLACDLLKNFGNAMPAERAQSILSGLMTGVSSMVRTIDDLLLAGNIEEGKLPRTPARFGLLDFLRKCCLEVQPEPPSRIEVAFRDAGLGVTADERLLRHVMINLLENALKYSPDDAKVELGAEVGPGSLTLSVRDRGIGVPEAERKFLFDAFSRASNVGDKPGSGLGLFITQKCAQAHGGRVRYSPQPDGSVFSVTIPLAAAVLNPTP